MNDDIRDQRIADHSAHEILHAMGDSVIVLDPEGRIETVNRAALELLGYEKDRLVGRPWITFLEEPYRSSFRMPEILNAGITRNVPLILTSATDQRVPVSASISVRYDDSKPCNVICVARSLVATHESDESQKRSEDGFRCFIEHAADAFFALDGTGRITDVNTAACEALGYRRDELMTKSLADIEMKFSLEQYELLWETLEPGDPIALDGVQRRSDGSTFEAEARLSAIELDGRKQLFALIRDVAEQRQIERELVEARETAIEASRLKSEFLANMSHEIRTPMNAVMGLTELVLETSLSSEQREFLETALASATSLLRLIDDILDFSKIEAGKIALEETSFSLSSCVTQALQTLHSRADEKNLVLSSDCPQDLPDAVAGDPGRIRQILMNLVSNAIKFTENGQVTVGVRLERSASRSGEFDFTVSDTGVGIPPDKLDAIFETFAQIDGSSTRRVGGTGLGLAICRRLTTAMGGRIWVDSEPGVGTTVHVSLPLELRPDDAGRADPTTAEIERLSVIVAGGVDAARERLGGMLRKWGMIPTEAPSATDVSSALRGDASEHPPRLVLLDRDAPGDTFEHVAAAIRHEPRLGDVPVLVLASETPDEPPSCLRDLRVAGWVNKPIEDAELLKTIEAAVDAPTRIAGALPVKNGCSHDDDLSLRILVAEDSPVNRLLIERILQRRGHDVVSVVNGREAVSALEDNAFDLVLMDVQMPVLDGFEATACIRGRENASGTHVPIIALTAHAMKGDRERCLAEGMDDYVAKPICSDELTAVIERWSPGGSREPSKPSKTSPKKETALPVLDADHLSTQSHGDRDLESRLARLFLDESPRLLHGLHDSLANEDALAIEKAAHRMKGSLSTLGALRAADVIGRIEAAARRGDADAAARLVPTVEQELERVRFALSKFAAPVAAV